MVTRMMTCPGPAMIDVGGDDDDERHGDVEAGDEPERCLLSFPVVVFNHVCQLNDILSFFVLLTRLKCVLLK